MTTKTENKNRLLSTEEWAIFSQIVSKDPPHSQRAQALLAIDKGATQVEAGRQAGLTKGRVHYWLGKFRKERTSIFPEELLNQAQQEDAGSPQGSAEAISSPDMPDLAQAAGEKEAQQEVLDAEDTPKAKKKSKKKSKEARKSEKVKKPKKDKKAKKGKKSKKKTKKKQSKKAKGAKSRSGKKAKKKRKK